MVWLIKTCVWLNVVAACWAPVQIEMAATWKLVKVLDSMVPNPLSETRMPLRKRRMKHNAQKLIRTSHSKTLKCDERCVHLWETQCRDKDRVIVNEQAVVNGNNLSGNISKHPHKLSHLCVNVVSSLRTSQLTFNPIRTHIYCHWKNTEAKTIIIQVRMADKQRPHSHPDPPTNIPPRTRIFPVFVEFHRQSINKYAVRPLCMSECVRSPSFARAPVSAVAELVAPDDGVAACGDEDLVVRVPLEDTLLAVANIRAPRCCCSLRFFSTCLHLGSARKLRNKVQGKPWERPLACTVSPQAAADIVGALWRACQISIPRKLLLLHYTMKKITLFSFW